MKQLLFILSTIFCFSTAHAQLELKVNPLGSVFGTPQLTTEIGVSDHFGIEPVISYGKVIQIPFVKYITIKEKKYSWLGWKYGVNAKYYFGSESNLDKFYAGVFLRGGNSEVKAEGDTKVTASLKSFGGGLHVGYKFLTENNLVFDINLGLGRKFTNRANVLETKSFDVGSLPFVNLIPYFKINFGYRFGGGGRDY